MNRIVVIFESKYGSTKRYAEWISDALSCPVYEKNKFPPNELMHYDTIIYGGGLYAGGVSGISLLTKNFSLLRNKNVILFTCGLADPADPANTRHILESLSKVLSPEMPDNIQIFHLRGGIDYSKLTLVHKSMMKMLYKMLAKQDYSSLRNEDRQMLDTYGKIVDFTSRETIEPLVGYVLSL